MRRDGLAWRQADAALARFTTRPVKQWLPDTVLASRCPETTRMRLVHPAMEPADDAVAFWHWVRSSFVRTADTPVVIVDDAICYVARLPPIVCSIFEAEHQIDAMEDRIRRPLFDCDAFVIVGDVMVVVHHEGRVFLIERCSSDG